MTPGAWPYPVASQMIIVFFPIWYFTNLLKLMRYPFQNPLNVICRVCGKFPCHITLPNAWQPFWWWKVSYRKSYFMRAVSLCISQIKSLPPSPARQGKARHISGRKPIVAVPLRGVVISEPENFSACGLQSSTVCCKETGTSPKGNQNGVENVSNLILSSCLPFVS